MSIAQARVNVFMKSFCEKQILRERLWSPRNDDVSISYLENFQILKIQKRETNNINFNNHQLHRIILISHIYTTSSLFFHSSHILQFLRAECPFTSTFSKKISKLFLTNNHQHLHNHSFYEIIIFNNFEIICFNFNRYNTSTFILNQKIQPHIFNKSNCNFTYHFFLNKIFIPNTSLFSCLKNLFKIDCLFEKRTYGGNIHHFFITNITSIFSQSPTRICTS
jgi:hypothetical protein